MYRVVRRVSEGFNGLGTYLVEFSIELPKDVRRAYLIGDFNSWSVGSAPLTRVGRRAYVRVVLPRGRYRYAYYLGHGRIVHDEEVGRGIKTYIPSLNHEVEVSKVVVGYDDLFSTRLAEGIECLSSDYCLIRLASRYLRTDLKVACVEGNKEFSCSSEEGVIRCGSHFCYEYLIPCTPKEVTIKGGDSELRYVRNPRTKYVGSSWLWRSAVLEITVDDAMDRYDDVLVAMKYLGVKAIRLKVTPHSFLRPEEMLDLGEGGSKDVSGLVKSLSSEGASVILDLPLTYVTPCFKGFLDVIERGSKSLFSDWFVVLDSSLWRGVGISGPSLTTRSSCYVVYELMKELQSHDVVELETLEPPTLRLNLNSLGVMRTMERTVKFWINVGCRGLVISRSYSIPPEYLTAITEVVKEVRGDAVVLGESITSPTYQLINSSIDGVVDYGLGYLILKLVRGSLSTYEFTYNVMMRYLSSSLSKVLSTYVALPEEPVCSLINEDEAKLTYALILALPGPLTLAESCINEYYSSYWSLLSDWRSKVLEPLIKDLSKVGVKVVEIHEPSLVWGGTKKTKVVAGAKELGKLIKFCRSLGVDVWVITYFGYLGRVGKYLSELSDAVIEKLADKTYWLKVGELSKLVKSVARAGTEEVYVGNNAPMDFIPEVVAAKKLRRLGRVISGISKG